MNEPKTEDVISVFAACNGLAPTEEVDCALCPFCDYDAHKKCTEELAKAVIAAFRELKCQVNRLKKYDEERDIRLHARLTETARAEAITEFVERVKEKIHKSVYQYWNEGDGGYYLAEDVDDDIDQIAKEMRD